MSSFTLVQVAQAGEMRQLEEIKGIKNRKNVKLFLFVDDMVYTEKIPNMAPEIFY